jgi:hypothetical protein
MFHANGDPVVSSSLSREYESAAQAAGKPVTGVYYEGVRHPAALPPVAGAPDSASKADAATRAMAFLRAALVTPVRIEGTATGDEVVPRVPGTSGARVSVTFNSATRDLGYTITLSGISAAGVKSATLNRGDRGSAGLAIRNLQVHDSLAISGWLRLSAAEAADFFAGSLYVSLQSEELPDGFARMQLTPAALAGRIQPPSTGDAGLAQVPYSTRPLP